MTVKKILELFEKLRPNSFDFDTKLMWLDEVEGLVQSEIFGVSIDEIKHLEGEDDILRVPHPYARLYFFYLSSMIDFFSGNFEKYQASSLAYNDAVKLYAKFVVRGGK